MNDLNEEFGISGKVKFSTGSGGLPKAVLSGPGGHVAEIYLQGATVTSWRPPSGPDLLFTSAKAVFERGKAIRGGIPLIFPQFGPGKLPSHGFARSMEWRVTSSGAAGDRPSITFGLSSSEDTIVLWPHQFESTISFEVGASLTVRWRIANSGSSAFELENALHTYFRLGSVDKVKIEGLGGLDYLDNLSGRSRGHDDRHAITISEEVDRVYLSAPEELSIRDESLGRTIRIVKKNLTDSVLWNPWTEKAKKLSDFGDEEYREMVCVEAGNIAEPRKLAPGQSLECSMTLSYA